MLLLLAALGRAAPLTDAVAALNRNDCATASPLFEAARRSAPQDARAIVGQGLCAARQGRDAEALAELSLLLTLKTGVQVEGESRGLDGVAPAERPQVERQMAELVRLVADHGRAQDVDALLVKMDAAFGRSGAREASSAYVERILGGMDRGWARLAASVAAHPDDALLLDGAARMVFKGATGLPQAVEDAIAKSGSPGARYDLVAGLLNAKMTDRCNAVVRGLDTTQLPEAPLLGYRCALLADDAAQVTRRREELLAAGALPAREAVIDASMLSQRGDPDTALVVLARAKPANDAERAQVAGSTAVAAAKKGDWDTAVAAVKTPGVDPRTGFALATQLARVGRSADARQLVQDLCLAQPQPQRESCLAAAPKFGGP